MSVLLISNNSSRIWRKWGLISKVSTWALINAFWAIGIFLRYQVNMFFLHGFHPFYILPPELDLRGSFYLRLLQFDVNIKDGEIRKSQVNHVIQWFNSICESVTSKSLVVEVRWLTQEVETCEKIQDTLLALYERMETFSVYLTPQTNGWVLFSKLHEAGIAIEEDLWKDEGKQVGYCILTPYLLYSSLSFLASRSFPPMRFYSIPQVFCNSQVNVCMMVRLYHDDIFTRTWHREHETPLSFNRRFDRHLTCFLYPLMMRHWTMELYEKG